MAVEKQIAFDFGTTPPDIKDAAPATLENEKAEVIAVVADEINYCSK